MVIQAMNQIHRRVIVEATALGTKKKSFETVFGTKFVFVVLKYFFLSFAFLALMNKYEINFYKFHMKNISLELKL